jgi:divalent metal cation (Fe/Co/Zn/Cd) transporter
MSASVARAVVASRGSWTLAYRLILLTLTWNVIEGIVAVSAGVGAGSVALIGFGLDSGIEVTASAVLLWRLNAGDDARTEARERAARRVVGATFMVLAFYILAQAAYVVVQGESPEASRIGLVLACMSLAFMPAIAIAKRRNARRLHSHALMGEAKETLVCSYLSVALVVGLSANAALGWWWADIAAALAMVPWIAKEGIEGLRAEGCGVDCMPQQGEE